MEWQEYEKRYYLCSVIYGLFISLSCFWVWSSGYLFTIVGIVIIAAITIALAINIISLIHIKSILQIIKIIFCEIVIAIVLCVFSMPFWLMFFYFIGVIIDFISPLLKKMEG